MADETPIPVQTKDKPGSTHKGYHWVYYAPHEKLVCFDYRKGRGGRIIEINNVVEFHKLPVENNLTK